MTRNLLDLMPKEERDKALDRAQKRMDRQRSRRGLDVSPEMFITSELGYYFGWEAVMAVRRGYTIVPGTNEKELFTLDEAMVLLEGARKVWYSKLIEQSHVGVVSNSFKSSANTFDNAIGQFKEKADLKE